MRTADLPTPNAIRSLLLYAFHRLCVVVASEGTRISASSPYRGRSISLMPFVASGSSLIYNLVNILLAV